MQRQAVIVSDSPAGSGLAERTSLTLVVGRLRMTTEFIDTEPAGRAQAVLSKQD